MGTQGLILNTKASRVDWQKAYDEYRTERLTITEVGKRYGVHAQTVLNRWSQSGLHRSGDYRHVRVPYMLNEQAFDKWSSEMAYWLGFLSADGGLGPPRRSYSIKVGLTERDGFHLDKFRKFLSLTKEVRYRNSMARLEFNNRVLHGRLLSLGLVPGKSLKDIDFLKKVPPRWYIPFIFGFFDGDGCATHASPNVPVWSIGGPETFLKSIHRFFVSQGLLFACNKDKKLKCGRMQWKIYTSIPDNLVWIRKQYLELGIITLDRKRQQILTYPEE